MIFISESNVCESWQTIYSLYKVIKYVAEFYWLLTTKDKSRNVMVQIKWTSESYLLLHFRFEHFVFFSFKKWMSGWGNPACCSQCRDQFSKFCLTLEFSNKHRGNEETTLIGKSVVLKEVCTSELKKKLFVKPRPSWRSFWKAFI